MSLESLLHTTLQNTFGLTNFRHGQKEAITALLNQNRLICILPTGYGKSLLYQLPAVLFDGLTIVISPLLALMRDQIDHLKRRFKIEARAINSDQSELENNEARRMAQNGEIKILFIAPEQLDHIDHFHFLLNLNIHLVVIDEAHCISTWGHDFRPSYRQILKFVEAVSLKNEKIKILGLTATANKHVEEDIQKQLFSSKNKGQVIRQSMDRPNIGLTVIPLKGLAQKLYSLRILLDQLEGSGLIYCATRENTELVASYLQSKKYLVTSYHAGYETEEKKKLQSEFINDKYKALAATNALGMGIDKPNLRFIIHFDFPGSITAYYQEIGRCGRDGLKAKAIMLFDIADYYIHEYFIQSAVPTPQDFQIVLNAIENADSFLGLMKIKSLTGLHPTRVTIVIAELIEQGYLVKLSHQGKQVYKLTEKKQDLDLSRYNTQQLVKTEELKSIVNYGKSSYECRMRTLRKALGDKLANKCLNCDCCDKPTFQIDFLAFAIAEINQWLDNRPVVIHATVKENISEGLSIFDSKRRSQVFVRFMKDRANSLEIDENLISMIHLHLTNLKQSENIGALILIPSRTWKARDNIASKISNSLNIPLFSGILNWIEVPQNRQGELLNNDQRKENVNGRMLASKMFIPPEKTIILFDDYTGSGNTLKEAVRALRSSGYKNKIIPFTIANVKWHLGKPGFI